VSHAVLAVAGCKSTTRDVLEFVDMMGYPVGLLITLDPQQGAQHAVAGYEDLAAYASARGVAVHLAERYDLTGTRDQLDLGHWDVDALLVMGWQRLLPGWLLERLSIGAFGMHGSSEPLPKGRGRSPMNWSLIQGRSSFLTNLFRYDAGIDSGAVVASQGFEITPFDTAESLHMKNTVAMCHLLRERLPALLAGQLPWAAQEKGHSTYYPQRRAEDGEIFWEDPAEEIRRLVAAVGRPFPGAITYGPQGEPVKVWRAAPFDRVLSFPDAVPGEIVFAPAGRSFVVKAGDSTLWVQEWEGSFEPRVGTRLTRRAAYRWDWRKLPMDSPRFCSHYSEIPEDYRRD
jgi:UDP-4-amino-4-deoxy-L-arabinose formyltransferase/UDP-glucuronic acid dehydrogenase (UDP-4-keto-hexauronic acid decarboxylating)